MGNASTVTRIHTPVSIHSYLHHSHKNKQFVLVYKYKIKKPCQTVNIYYNYFMHQKMKNHHPQILRIGWVLFTKCILILAHIIQTYYLLITEVL
jgi:hypothetical protein